MKRRKTAIVVISTILLFTCLLYFNSFNFALSTAGIDHVNYYEIDPSGIDLMGNEYKVILSTSAADPETLAVAVVTKNSLGLWQVTGCSTTNPHNPDTVVYHWMGYRGTLQPTEEALKDGLMSDQLEYHVVLCGKNPKKQVGLRKDQIPYNVTFNVQRNGDLYWVHAMTYGESTNLDTFDIRALLEGNGCIELN